MKYVCPECGYHAGENGEKILQLQRSVAHGKTALSEMTPQQLALIRREDEVVISPEDISNVRWCRAAASAISPWLL